MTQPVHKSKPPETDPLVELDAELDDTIICECTCSAFPDRHGPARCGQRATHYVEVHRFASCQHPTVIADPNVTSEGDLCAYLCSDCFDSGIALAQAQMSRLPDNACCPPLPSAYGCGRPMTTLDDYIPVRRTL
ncbi:hypothetical protein [Mycolicibacterium komossense]|uniref:Uncharacterized protein n=1 Tax=Mycolicibacterium komossense TaxID=1779 RepID=A0ABT3CMU3_9MYCO|nr:hypothetical protein [Mycolicibacterium komossense]MCV7230697.1 hypothetical protein [Mycolicibacterium komossense]